MLNCDPKGDIVSNNRGEILHSRSWPQEYSEDAHSSNRRGRYCDRQ